jgi:hypothetical protein
MKKLILPSPSDPRLPFVASDEQAEIVLRFYEQAKGSFKYRRADHPRQIPTRAVLGWPRRAVLVNPALRLTFNIRSRRTTRGYRLE